MKTTRRLAPVMIAFGIATACHAELRLPNIFSDHMVIQRDQPITVWGWAKAGAQVDLSFAGRTAQKEADTEGRWEVELAAMPANVEPSTLMVVSGDTTIVVNNILIGDVWLCGGQSNMEWTLRSTRDADVEIPSADFPAIRFIRVPKVARLTPQDDFPVKSPQDSVGNWRLCTSEYVENCTAVGYYFAKRIHRHLRVPIGLIDTSWGGTMAQHWVTKETLREIPEVDPYFEKFESAVKLWNEGGGADGAMRRYEEVTHQATS